MVHVVTVGWDAPTVRALRQGSRRLAGVLPLALAVGALGLPSAVQPVQPVQAVQPAQAVQAGTAGRAARDAAAQDPAPRGYVVVDDGSGRTAAALAALGAAPLARFEAADASSVELTASQAAWLAARPGVVDVAPDPVVRLADATAPVPTTGVQRSPAWNLDRMDQAAPPLDGSFGYPGSAGRGVLVYVVDSGVLAAHSDLGGRVTSGYSAVAAEPSATTDGNGHGTHVAGTIASTTFGVAKGATVVPVKVVAADGTGTGSQTLAGLDWILKHHPAGWPGVVNMSLTMDSAWAPLDAEVAALTAAGLTVVVAAGNGGVDACPRSPARAPSALTVGATTASDARAPYSNVGSCLDVFAPGDQIPSLTNVDGMAALRSGTSMAAANASGAAALLLGITPGATPAQVAAALLAGARRVVTGPGASSLPLLLTTLGLPPVAGELTSVVADPRIGPDLLGGRGGLAIDGWYQGPRPGDFGTAIRVVISGRGYAETGTGLGLAPGEPAEVVHLRLVLPAGVYDLSLWAFDGATWREFAVQRGVVVT